MIFKDKRFYYTSKMREETIFLHTHYANVMCVHNICGVILQIVFLFFSWHIILEFTRENFPFTKA